MAEVITTHPLKHIQKMRIDPELLKRRYSSKCSMSSCDGTCCSEGVLLDVEEKEKILHHAHRIKQYLEPDQEQNDSKWFDDAIQYDIDFPSGQCDGTSVHHGRCVFQNSSGLCTLQVTAVAEGMSKFALKPFFCVAFPLVIAGHTLTFDEPDFTMGKECCSTISNGTLSIIDVFREEFEFILGHEGFLEIENLFLKAT
jgi:Fe-S-cluster containining protein